MDTTPVNRAYLETLSTDDLVLLADDFGIDIPEGLNRRFIIGELLELAEYDRSAAQDAANLSDAEFTEVPDPLPETYNETSISILLRDPQWVHVYWDVQSILLVKTMNYPRFESFFLRVNTLKNTDGVPTVTDFFDIDVSERDRSWYVYLSAREYACRIDLCVRNSQEKEQVLAKSRELVLPAGGPGEYAPGNGSRSSPILALSGIDEMRKAHFRNQRQPLT